MSRVGCALIGNTCKAFEHDFGRVDRVHLFFMKLSELGVPKKTGARSCVQSIIAMYYKPST